MKTNKEISIQPENSFADQRVIIKLSGFDSKQKVTLRSEMSNYYCVNVPYYMSTSIGEKSVWESFAVFEADNKGIIDVSTQAPISGMYSGVDSMGLFWTMKIKKAEVEEKPLKLVDIKINRNYIITFTAEVNGEVVATQQHIRNLINPKVKIVDVNEDGLVARYFTMDNDIAKPAIIVVSGSDGGINKAQTISALLASYDYSVLALSYFDLEDLPNGIEKIPLEYIEKAIKWTKNQKTITKDKICIYGRSKGGELALLSATKFHEIRAVIAHTPSVFINQGLNKDRKPSKCSSWTYEGKELPYLKISFSAILKYIIKKLLKKPVKISDLYKHSLENNKKAENFMIPVEKINGPILLISAEDDAVWPSTIFCQKTIERLNHYGFNNHYEHFSYENAGHYITLPYQPIPTLQGNGGDYKSNEIAAENSWGKTIAFLKMHFPT
ncbi:MAG TPA: acyl-CoA thioester hydrolase/BAAT C-terminal domain-containing protein [Candidatus Paceibacterota bacterium]